MKVAIAYNKRGLRMAEAVKSTLLTLGHEILDYSTTDDEVDDADIAYSVSRAVIEQKAERAIVICGSGLCTSICANKFKGLYAAPCYDVFEAHLARYKFNTNVLCLSDLWTDPKTTSKIVIEWINTPFHESSAAVRLQKKIQQIESEHLVPKTD